MLDPPDRTDRRINFGCSVLLAVSLAVVISLQFLFLPWPWWLLIVALVAWGMYEARKRDIEWPWWWWWPWWW